MSSTSATGHTGATPTCTVLSISLVLASMCTTSPTPASVAIHTPVGSGSGAAPRPGVIGTEPTTLLRRASTCTSDDASLLRTQTSRAVATTWSTPAQAIGTQPNAGSFTLA